MAKPGRKRKLDIERQPNGQPSRSKLAERMDTQAAMVRVRQRLVFQRTGRMLTHNEALNPLLDGDPLNTALYFGDLAPPDDKSRGDARHQGGIQVRRLYGRWRAAIDAPPPRPAIPGLLSAGKPLDADDAARRCREWGDMRKELETAGMAAYNECISVCAFGAEIQNLSLLCNALDRAAAHMNLLEKAG